MSALPLMLLFLSAVALTFQSCKGKSKSNNLSAATDSLSDDALMDTVQRRTFLYFWPTADIVIICGLGGISLQKWYKWFTPLFLILFVTQAILLGIATGIGF